MNNENFELNREEFKGIDPYVLALNVSIVEDIEYDPFTHDVIATPIADALGIPFVRFPTSEKGWEQFGTRPTAALFTGEDGEVWQAKIFGQTSDGKRTGDYLAPKGIGDKPYLPSIPRETVEAIAACYKVPPPAPDELVWEWFLKHKKIPLIITEGGKKALAAASQGNIALSLYGVNCGARDLAIKPELLPYVEGRLVIIAFDRDLKSTTQHKVFKATKRLGNAIFYHAKGAVKIASWDRNQGKGIDDLIANDPELFHGAIANAKPFEQWKLERYTNLTPYITAKVNNRYLETLSFPETAKVIAIKSPKGTGKTEAISREVEKAIAAGIPCIVLSHREQLVRELSNRFGLEYRTELTRVGKQLGYGLCIDSLHQKANPPFNADSWEGCWVILDECEQVIWHLLNSKTCQYNRSAIIETLITLLNGADRIFLADADLSKISLDYVTRLLDEPVTPWVLVNDWKPQTPLQAFTYETPEDLFFALQESIENGDRVMVHTGGQKAKSRWGTTSLECALSKEFPDLKILRLDAESVSDPTHPAYGSIGNLNVILPLYDVVIASPVLETGVSIEGNHFDQVFCFASGSQSVQAVCQAIARVRSDVPRHLWIKSYSSQRIGNGSHDPDALLKSQDKLFKTNSQILGISDASSNIEEKSSQNLITWATIAAIHNYGSKHYQSEVYRLLAIEGYNLAPIASRDEAEAVKASMKAIADENYQTYCEKVTDAPILSEFEMEKAKRKKTKTESERLAEKKTAIANRYLTEDITPPLVQRDDEGLYGQLQLHYFLTVGQAFLKDRDRKKVEALSSQGRTFKPDVNRRCMSVKVKALEAINIEQFFDNDRNFSNADVDLREWLEKLISCRRDTKDILGMNISAEFKIDKDTGEITTERKETPIGVAQRLLGLMGLKMTCLGQKRDDQGNRVRYYQMIDLNPDDRNAIFDRWFKRDSALCHTPPIDINYRGDVTSA